MHVGKIHTISLPTLFDADGGAVTLVPTDIPPSLATTMIVTHDAVKQ
jgi:hypothetical protein